jgi:hypothetical protein
LLPLLLGQKLSPLVQISRDFLPKAGLDHFAGNVQIRIPGNSLLIFPKRQKTQNNTQASKHNCEGDFGF